MLIPQKPSEIGNLVRDKILKYEFIFLLIIVLTYAGKLLNLPFPIEIVFFSLMTIAIIYFFSTFQTPEKIGLTGFDLFFVKFCAISSSVAVMGILYSFLKISGYKEMLLIGSFSLLPSFVYILNYRIKNQDSGIFTIWVLFRCLLLIAIAIAQLWNTFN
jgi:hypothetical protein